MIHRYWNLLHGFRDNSIADGTLNVEKRLRLGMLIGTMEEDDLLNFLMILEESKEFGGIHVPSVLSLRMVNIRPINEDERFAFEREERSGHEEASYIILQL
jgi:hypothetical protein